MNIQIYDHFAQPSLRGQIGKTKYEALRESALEDIGVKKRTGHGEGEGEKWRTIVAVIYGFRNAASLGNSRSE